MQYLSARLQTIYDLVPIGATVADIGTDHAYLPIALSKSGKASKIIACDINESPLNKARENLAQFGIKNVETRLGNGLSPINENEVNTVVIAGMGGEVIKSILSSWSFTKNKDTLYLLQPMTGAEILRLYLMDNGFTTEKEIALIDNSKVYTVMSVRYSGIKKDYQSGYEYIGETDYNSVAGKTYVNKQLKRLQSYYNGISTIAEKQNEAAEIKNKIIGITKITEN